MLYIVFGGSYPNGMAATHRITCLAKLFKESGQKIKLCCYHRVYYSINDDNFPSDGIENDIPYCYISGKYKKTNKILSKLDWECFDAIRMYKYLMQHLTSKDTIFIMSSSIFMQGLVLFVAHKYGVKVIKEICEHPKALRGKSIKSKIENWFELTRIFPKYDAFISISSELEYLCRLHKKAAAKVVIIPILVEDDRNIDYSSMENPCPGVPYLLHTGTMLECKDGISIQLEAFAEFRHTYPTTPCKFIFAGPQSNEKCSFIPKMKELGIFDDVILVGMLDAKEVLRYQHYCAAGIIYRYDNLQNRCGFSTKSGEMLMSGHPVIITTIGDGKLYLKNEESAIIIEPGDKKALFQAITKVIFSPEMARSIGLEGRMVALSNFTPKSQIKKMENFLKNV